MIADEPTSALDVTVQAEVIEVLRGLRDRHGTALLFISHDLAVMGARGLAHGDGAEPGPGLRERAHRTGALGAPRDYTRALLAAVPIIGRRTSA